METVSFFIPLLIFTIPLIFIFTFGTTMKMTILMSMFPVLVSKILFRMTVFMSFLINNL